MRNRQNALNKVDQISNHMKTVTYIINSSHGSFDEYKQSVDRFYELLEELRSLISTEEESFRTNQIL